MTPQEARDRMKAQPFAPLDGSPEFRIATAIEYAAYYLGEIESHLSKIAAQAEDPPGRPGAPAPRQGS